MPTILETALQILAGSTLTPSVVFVWLWLRRQREPEYGWSALLGFSVTGYITCSVLEYRASDLSQYLAVFRWQPLFTSAVASCLLMLALGSHSKPSRRTRILVNTMASLAFLIGIARTIHPELTFQAVRLHSIELWKGIGRLQLLDGDASVYALPLWLFLIACAVTSYGVVRDSLKTSQNIRRTRILMYATIGLVASAVHDIFAVVHRFPWPYMTEPVFALIALMQAQRLSEDLFRSHSMRREMAARQEMFGLLFRSNPLACVITRQADGTILLANPRFMELMRADSEKEVIGRTSVEIGLWNDPEHRRQELLSQLGSEAVRHRGVWTRFDKSTLHVSHSVQKIHYDGVDCLLMMAEDIDQEARAEQALKEHVARTRDENAELERRVDQRTRDMQTALEELESFTYSVSHDLRSPLRAIDGFASALAEDHSRELGAVGNANIVRIRKATRRMSALIDDLLSLYRSSRVFVVRTDVDVSAIARDCLQKLSISNPERVVVDTVQENIKVHADAVLTGIAIEHLIQNAWKFTLRTTAPEIHIDSTVVDGAVWIRVRDNGAGFDMAHAGKLFGTFHRLHDAPEFEGNGIGLAIVKRVVTRHGGRIEVESRPGLGTEFRFCLEAGPE